MGGFRGGGLGVGPMRAERSPRGRNAGAGAAEPPKPKPNLKSRLWWFRARASFCSGWY